MNLRIYLIFGVMFLINSYDVFLYYVFLTLIILIFFVLFVFLVFYLGSHIYENLRDYRIDYELYKQVVFHRDCFVNYIKKDSGFNDTNNDC